MQYVLRGATVVDGTGAAGKRGDVLVEDGVITAVGEVGAVSGAEEVDLSGLVLAPGFIDSHTHYDAQILWDPDLTPSSWHGVTTVLMGNCGYSVAPVRPEARDLLVLTLEAVEGMSRQALQEGMTWGFESFPEYMDYIEALSPRLNVATMVGHTALRYWAMGEEAAEREATEAEVEEMATVLRDALRAGAFGLSTSQSGVDNGAYGKPVPSRLASRDEILRLMDVMAEVDLGIVQMLPGNLRDVPAAAKDLVEMAERSGRTIVFSSVLTGIFGGSGAAVEALEHFWTAGEGRVVPTMASRAVVQQIALKDPFTLTMLSEPFTEILAFDAQDRAAAYARPEWRQRVVEKARPLMARLAEAYVAESETHAALIGRTLGELAAERGTTPLDLLVDLSLDEGLETRFTVPLLNDDPEEVAQLLRDPRPLLSLSDAGAHQSQLCDAVFATHLLGHWVRERRAISLEKAIWRLTGHQAEVLGLHDRGVIKTGAAADLVAFDPDTIGTTPLERVWDLPSGADRLIGRGEGIQHVWINGVPAVTDGADTGQRPGRLIKGPMKADVSV